MSKHEDERRCENCWYCFFREEPSGDYWYCRHNPPDAKYEWPEVSPCDWCGKFYSKEMPPPWKPQLIHRLEPT